MAALATAVSAQTAYTQTDNPLRRWEYFYQQRAYPFNRIPPSALQAARRQALARWPAQLRGAPAMAAATWTPIGPERININIQSTGRLVAIAIHPTISSTMYVGGAQGGVWKSIDGGGTWMPLTDQECSLAMGSIAIDPVDPDIIYAGTGEQHFSADSYYGCGVLRSIDGGVTWEQQGASDFDTNTGGARISRVVVKASTAGSTNTTTVFAATTFGLYRSTNSGGMWTQVLSGTVTDLVIDPSNNQVMYAARRTDGISKSTDGGVTWNPANTGFPVSDVGRVNLAIAPSNPQILLASVQNSTMNDLLGIWKTSDGAANWAGLAATGASCGLQCWYDMTIAIHPTNPDVVYFGGVNLFKSTDGGANFSNISGSIHVDQHFFAFDPQTPSTVFVGNDGGIYKSIDGGTTWTTLNTNLALTQFYGGVSLHPSNANFAIGGTQDNGTVEYAGSADWTAVLSGDGGFTAIDFLDPTVRYAETQWTVPSDFSGPRRSDGGAYSRKVSGIDVSDRALFIPPLAMDPSSPETLYFGTFQVYKTTNRGETWSAVSSDLTNGGRGISAIAVAPSNSSVLYVGTSDAQVHVSTDNGATFLLRISGLPDRHIKDFAVDPADQLTALVTVSGFFSGHVFKTVNGGVSWQDISSTLPDVPVNAVLYDPATTSTIYVGTDLGVYRTIDGGGSWSPFNDGLPLIAVFDLAAEPNTGLLVAATHGRSMFKASITAPLSMRLAPGTTTATVDVGGAAVSDSAVLKIEGAGANSTTWTATTGDATWLNLTTVSGTGSSRVRWTVDPTGLTPATYNETITATAAVVSGSPATIDIMFTVKATIQLTVDPESRADTVEVGSTTAVIDSADVTLTGPLSGAQEWTATHTAAAWLTLTTASGTGSGKVHWSRDPTGLTAGAYVDTIVVTSTNAGGSPAMIVDTLLVQTAPMLALDPTSRADTTIAGATTAIADSASVNLTGFGSPAIAWTATHGGASWLTITTANGTGAGMVRWSRDPSGLSAGGTFVDTITVTAAVASGSPATVIDTILVAEQIALSDAAQHLLLGGVLSALQEAFLDASGNADGAYNLGDVLAWLDRCQSGTPTGCLASAANVQLVNEALQPLPERERGDTSDRIPRRERRQ
ncbi:MAG: hypothetical protein IIA44_04240 [Acidobacteria bacterium]|nr:hypothetical protein [Acidobacteriota bacterium]